MIKSRNWIDRIPKSLPKIEPYLFLLPFFITFFIFYLWPVLFNVIITFTDWRGFHAGNYIGLKNYSELLSSSTFRKAFFNTFWYFVVAGSILLSSGFIVSYFLNIPSVRGKKIFRTIYFLPVAASPVIIGIVFVVIYEFRYGVLNYILGILGFSPVNWLGDVKFSKPAVTGLFVWRMFGLIMMYYLVGLQGLDVSVLEAAEVDGANTWQTIFYIVLPLLRPVILFISVVVSIQVFQIFQEPIVLFSSLFLGGSGGPQDSALSIMQYVYRIGFSYQEMAKAATATLLFMCVIGGIAFLQMKYLGFFGRGR